MNIPKSSESESPAPGPQAVNPPVAHPQAAHPQAAHPQAAHPQPAHPQAAHAPVVVIPNTTVRDAIFAGIAGLLILGFIAFGVVSLVRDSEKAQSNTLTGVVVEKQFTPAPEQLISVGGKGLKSRQIDGEYLLKVQVGEGADQRIYEVPVEKEVYNRKSVGDEIGFGRPPSERLPNK